MENRNAKRNRDTLDNCNVSRDVSGSGSTRLSDDNSRTHERVNVLRRRDVIETYGFLRVHIARDHRDQINVTPAMQRNVPRWIAQVHLEEVPRESYIPQLTPRDLGGSG
jgi:hypothetical protein